MVSVRFGTHQQRCELRSGDMAAGSTRSAKAMAVGVMNRSFTTTKSTLFKARNRRGASAPMLAMGFVDVIHTMRMGYGSPVSMAFSTESAWAEEL